LESPTLRLARGQSLEVAAEHDVHASSGHVGGDRDRVQTPGLGHDLGFAEVLLRVQDFVRDSGFGEFTREQLGLLDRRRTEQNRLAEITALAHVLDDRGELRVLGLVDEVGLVEAYERLFEGIGTTESL